MSDVSTLLPWQTSNNSELTSTIYSNLSPNIVAPQVGVSTRSINTNPNYIMEIRSYANQKNTSIPPIRANVPEQISVSVHSDWQSRLPSTFGDISTGVQQALRAAGIVPAVITSGMFTFNFNPMVQAFSFQSWIGTSPIEMDFQLQFNAYENAGWEVVGPMQALQSLVLPTVNNKYADYSILDAPGPSPAHPYDNRISIRIGRMFYINSCVIIQCRNTFDNRMDASGQAISGQCDLLIRTINTPSRDDLNTMYSTAGYATNGNYDNYYGVRKVSGGLGTI